MIEYRCRNTHVFKGNGSSHMCLFADELEDAFPKYVFQSIYIQYPSYMSLVGNTGLKSIWKSFNKAKVDSLAFKKSKKWVYVENIQAEKEISEFYQELDEAMENPNVTMDEPDNSCSAHQMMVCNSVEYIVPSTNMQDF